MEIRLSKDLEQFVRDAARDGLYAGEDDVIREALTRLRQSLPSARNSPDRKSQADPKAGTVAPDELNRRLLESGLVIRLPDPDVDLDDAEDLPIEIHGEPLSETIIRERR